MVLAQAKAANMEVPALEVAAVIHVVLLTWLIAWGRGLYGSGLLGLATARKERKQSIHVNGWAMFLILDGAASS